MQKHFIPNATKTIGSLVICAFFAKAHAFCGFYVAKADASLFNKASQVALVRHEEKTVISMLNDYQGSLKEFAIVVPVPQVLTREQINVGDKALFDHLDAFSAPRLVEYYDPNPCTRTVYNEMMKMSAAAPMARGGASRADAKALGVTIEAQYTVGEYDILILSAKESSGLETWLKQNDYKIPAGASSVLGSYIKQDMKFFVAKVNLKEQSATGLTYLRPLQMAFDSKKFMLPIRLGTLNAKDGEQDLIVYAITKNGRVESTNYRTAKFPSDVNIPTFVRNEFPEFYKSLFTTQWKKENKKALFTEYFWNMSWCDPCAADPLSNEELRKLGVFWINEMASPSILPRSGRIMPRNPVQPAQAMITRLHVRYSRDTFPEDLMFQETQDQQNFQARYIMNIPWKGSVNECEEAKNYMSGLPKRHEQEAKNLAQLTGWDINTIRSKMDLKGNVKPETWWKNLWK